MQQCLLKTLLLLHVTSACKFVDVQELLEPTFKFHGSVGSKEQEI